jgi:hypothetical protein
MAGVSPLVLGVIIRRDGACEPPAGELHWTDKSNTETGFGIYHQTETGPVLRI